MTQSTLLIVDDDAAFRRRLMQLLSDELPAAIVTEAGTAEEALRLVSESPWDAVLLDIHLPARSGLDILPELRAMRPALPILMISHLPEDPYRSSSMRLGASSYVAKAHVMDRLVLELHRCLRIEGGA